jgi:hypothetical protein
MRAAHGKHRKSHAAKVRCSWPDANRVGGATRGTRRCHCEQIHGALGFSPAHWRLAQSDTSHPGAFEGSPSMGGAAIIVLRWHLDC